MSLSFSNEHNCFHNSYFMPLKKMFGDRNVQERKMTDQLKKNKDVKED